MIDLIKKIVIIKSIKTGNYIVVYYAGIGIFESSVVLRINGEDSDL